jgi:hypothetical protein
MGGQKCRERFGGFKNCFYICINQTRTEMTIKDLKEKIEKLPDDIPVLGYKGGNGDLYFVSSWIHEDEEGKIIFVISVD